MSGLWHSGKEDSPSSLNELSDLHNIEDIEYQFAVESEPEDELEESEDEEDAVERCLLEAEIIEQEYFFDEELVETNHSRQSTPSPQSPPYSPLTPPVTRCDSGSDAGSPVDLRGHDDQGGRSKSGSPLSQPSPRQVTPRKVAKLSPSAKKGLLRKKRLLETSRILLPDAPPRKRRTRMPSPERVPCCFASGAGPTSAAKAGPSSVPPMSKARTSSERKAGPSSVPLVSKAKTSSEPKAGSSSVSPVSKARTSSRRKAGSSSVPPISKARTSSEPKAGSSSVSPVSKARTSSRRKAGSSSVPPISKARTSSEPKAGPSSVPPVSKTRTSSKRKAGSSSVPPISKARTSSEPKAGPSSVPPISKARTSSEPKAGPSSVPPVSKARTSSVPPVSKARTSSEPIAGPSSKSGEGPSAALRQQTIETPDNAVIIEFIDMLDDGTGNPDVLSTGMDDDADVEVLNIPQTRKRTVTGIRDNESDNDFCLEDDIYPYFPQTKRTALAEPASLADYTLLERRILETEDAVNDRALRTIAPENAYDFTWHKEEAIFQGRQETFTGTPGPTFDMTDQTSILDVFYKMIDVEFIDMLCTQTNLYAKQKIDLLRSQNKLTTHSRLQQWVPTNRDEMITFLATLILQGLYPLTDEELYFKFNGFGTTPYFRCIMTYNRFFLIKSMLHFVNNDTANKRNKLWKIDPVIEYFNKKFSSLYYPSKEIAVDESLLKWSGKLSFSQKIARKAARVGVKTYDLCESSSGYLWKFIVYTGKDKYTDQPTDDTADQDKSTDDTADQDKSTDDTADQDKSTDDTADQDKPTDDTADQDKSTDDTADQDKPTDDTADQDKSTDDTADQDKSTDDTADQDKSTDDTADQDKPTDDTADQDKPTDDTADQDKLTDDTADQDNEGLDVASASTGLLTENSDVRPTNATALIVYKLVEPLLYRGHTLIMDNFYNSPLLARCLKRQKTDVYGTLRLNREFVPDSLKTLTKTDLRQGEVVVSYCSDLSVMVWRDANLVSMISTYHPLRVGTAKNDIHKPKIVLEYNKNMGGVDRKDQFLSAQPMERSRNRVWYKKLFRRLFSAAIFNSYIIFNTKNANMSHRRFRTLLAENLLKAHRQLNIHSMTMPMLTRKNGGAKRCIVEDDHFPMRTGSKKTRCWLCTQRKVDKRTSWKCIQCQVNLCIEGCFRAYHKE